MSEQKFYKIVGEKEDGSILYYRPSTYKNPENFVVDLKRGKTYSTIGYAKNAFNTMKQYYKSKTRVLKFFIVEYTVTETDRIEY